MWNSPVNTNFAKCFILFMAIVILLQGCAYLGLSTTALILRQQTNNSYNLQQQPLQTIFNLIYFPHEENISVTNGHTNNSEESTTLISHPNGIAQRTFILLITYTVVSSLWIITSLFVLGSLCMTNARIVIRIYFVSWFICIIIGCIVDIISTGFYACDILNTTNSSKTFEYIHLEIDAPPNGTKKNFTSYESYFVIPSVIMTCITSRLILIWIFNITGSSFCLSLSRVLSQRNISSVKSITNGHATTAVASTQTMLDQSTQYDEQHQEQPVIPVHINQPLQSDIEQPKIKYLQHVANISRQPSTKSSTQPSVKSSIQSFFNNVEETKSNQINSNMLHQHMFPETSLNNARYMMANGQDNYQNTNTHNNNNYNSNPQHNSICHFCTHVNEELKDNNDRANYYNQSNMHVNEDVRNSNHHQNYHNNSNMHISEELRSHLPWSYTEIRPRSSIIQPHSHPVIPPPDYSEK